MFILQNMASGNHKLAGTSFTHHNDIMLKVACMDGDLAKVQNLMKVQKVPPDRFVSVSLVV